jgi:hypothetical protein
LLWHLPISQWGRFGLCFVAIVAFGLLLIWPEGRRVRELDRRREALRERIRSQEMLYPLYQAHVIEIQRLKQYRIFPAPEPGDSAPSAQEAMAAIRDLLRDHGFSDLMLAPDMAVFNQEKDRLALDIRMNGSFLKLRDLLLSLGRLPAVIHFERLEIREAPDAGEVVDLRVWLLRK